MSYWKAYPHKWGPGCSHAITPEGDKTLCGKRLASIPGEPVPESESGYPTCGGCIRAIERAKQLALEWE